ncbi:hypothetical protein SCLCIDRAFT_438022 [Scleroderma citrinum Foug A]|uniref:Uncharacterized protein n=1 Tax=Scleroderma citrinum Foug A TaxID=1036808 RepID=A0A0C3DBC1_9AGAM|nr:hypothetical protein SCLCIDRAFT_438022 [Scleroderma citrinum Foug A]
MAPNRRLRKRAGTSGWPKGTRRKATGTLQLLKYFKGISIVLPHTASREARLWAGVAYTADEKSPSEPESRADRFRAIDQYNESTGGGHEDVETKAPDAFQDTGSGCVIARVLEKTCYLCPENARVPRRYRLHQSPLFTRRP